MGVGDGDRERLQEGLGGERWGRRQDTESRANTALRGPLPGGKERRAQWSTFTADDAAHPASGLSRARGAQRGSGGLRSWSRLSIHMGELSKTAELTPLFPGSERRKNGKTGVRGL